MSELYVPVLGSTVAAAAWNKPSWASRMGRRRGGRAAGRGRYEEGAGLRWRAGLRRGGGRAAETKGRGWDRFLLITHTPY